jgi:large subunit ribosomal protein L25
MNQVDLAVNPRKKNSKNENRRARRNGQLPAVVYGTDLDPQPVVLEAESFQKLLSKVHRATIFNLKINGDGAEQKAIIRDIQRDPVTSRLVHIDFYRIRLDKPINVDVSIHGVGTPAGLKLGGVLETINRMIEVRCLPLQVPEFIEVHISHLVIGQSIHVYDLKVPEGIEVLSDEDMPLFIMAAPMKEEEVKPVVPAEGEAVAAAEGAAPAEGAAAAAPAADAKAEKGKEAKPEKGKDKGK